MANILPWIMSFAARYGVTILLSIVAWNTLSNVPPISWLDGDKRSISRLEKQISKLEKDNQILQLNNLELKTSVADQNIQIGKLEQDGQTKQNQLDKTFNKLVNELLVLKDTVKEQNLDINTCQDLVDHLIQ